MIPFSQYLFIPLWLIALLCFRRNLRSSYHLYPCMVLLIAGLGSFSVFMFEWLIPSLENLSFEVFHPSFISFLRIGSSITLCGYYLFLPYVLLISAVHSSSLQKGKRIGITVAATLLVLWMLASIQWGESIALDVKAIRPGAGILFGAGLLLYICSYYKEKDQARKAMLGQLTVFFIVLFALIYVSHYWIVEKMIIQNDHVLLLQSREWHYEVLISFWIISSFLIFSRNGGFLGITLGIEPYAGIQTTMINHSLKNEIEKLMYLSRRMKGHLQIGEMKESLHTIETFEQIYQHMKHTLLRMKQNTEPIHLDEGAYSLTSIIEASLASLGPMIVEKQVQVEKRYECNPTLVCDEYQLKELFNNLIMNSLEAMGAEDGRLGITISNDHQQILVEIKDNGHGIASEEIHKVFQPYYSTKWGGTHYGLGLYFCSRVMQIHGGKIELLPMSEGTGAKVQLKFPKKRLVKRN